jgi:hypothetical protein
MVGSFVAALDQALRFIGIRVSNTAFASGTLGGASLVIPMAGAPIPCTITLSSTDATRKIEWSADGGTIYFEAVYNYNITDQLVFILANPITHIKFTGLSANAYRIG